jgi:protein-S-isoprenylcysteine O-methyltransferase Ste14
MDKLIFFALFTIFIIIISRKSLRSPSSHGFYRFFAWECIAALFAINVHNWFLNPFAWYQVVSWILLIASFIPLVFGVKSLVNKGKPTRQREGEPILLAFEKTSTLVTTGIYRYIRHPLYSSLLLLTWGIFFKDPGLTGIALAAVSSVFLFATARADETECLRFFGGEYQEYMRRTKRFIPLIF